MRDVLRYLEIPPQEEPGDIGEQEVVKVPELVGKDVVAAQAELHLLGLSGKSEGPGTTVVSQFPIAGARVLIETNVILYTEDDETPGEGMVKVPSLMGLGLTQARAKQMCIRDSSYFHRGPGTK